MIVAPCKDCPDKHMKCHSECEKYKEFQVECEERRKKIANKKQIETLLCEHLRKAQKNFRPKEKVKEI